MTKKCIIKSCTYNKKLRPLLEGLLNYNPNVLKSTYKQEKGYHLFSYTELYGFKVSVKGRSNVSICTIPGTTDTYLWRSGDFM